MTTQTTSGAARERTTKLGKADLAVPAALIALSIVPVLGGLVRLARASGFAAVPADDARFVAAPLPVVIHVVVATVYALLGALQFSPGFRRRSPVWHRRAGKLLVVCGLFVALSGLWMTAFYAIPLRLQGPLLRGVRIVVGLGMLAALVAGWLSIRERKVDQHEAWMMRAYALAQGAGTQAVVMLPLLLVTGEVVGFPRDVLMSLAWALNLGAAEWWIRRRRRPGAAGVSRRPSFG